ncbi:MAG: L,D-transpeptidase family protein, partial [Flavobacteriales bacterium]|nr:L,D-transpeptidase family protein [Flavobacteriales bacterium]
MKALSALLLYACLLYACTAVEEIKEEIDIQPETKTYPKVRVEKAPEGKKARVVSLSIEKHFADWTDSTLMKVDSRVLETSALLKPFYENRAYRLAWWNSTNLAATDSKCAPCIEELLNMLHHAHYYGLDSNWYGINMIDELLASISTLEPGKYDFEALANVDLLMTNAYFHFATHLNQGVTDSVSAYGLERHRLSTDLPPYLGEALDKKTVQSSLVNMQPQSRPYTLLQHSLELFLQTFDLNNDKVTLPDPKKFEDSCLAEATQVLIGLHYLNDSNATSEKEVTTAIKKFQKEHGLSADGAVGKNTVAALQQSTNERFQAIAVNLEKLRWEVPWSDNHLFVNIPEYKLHLVQNFETVKTHKLVVGNKKARTPQEINSQLEFLVTFPFWHVPRGIAVKEILPHIKKDSNYLASHHYELMGKGWKAVNPKTVDWTKITPDYFPYRIRQMGGPWNAVGLVKFIFPNEHFVYLHDTPSKNYFNKEHRAFSHGCLRLHKPMDFAEYLLKVDSNSYTVDSVQAHIDRKNSRKMRFKSPLPIYIRYYTCEADADHNIYYFRDVYG